MITHDKDGNWSDMNDEADFSSAICLSLYCTYIHHTYIARSIITSLILN